MKRLHKILALLICGVMLMATCAMTAFAAPSTGDLLKYIPTEITITSDTFVIDGYFVNMNSDVAISNLNNFELELYEDGDLVISGDFGTINQFTVPPMGMVRQKFSFPNDGSWSTGSYTCKDYTYAVVNCNFSTSRTV